MSDEILNIQAFILNQQQKYDSATGELSSILNEIALGAKIVSREINKAGLVDLLGLTGKVNVQGEEVQKLDEYANDVFVRIFERGNHIAGVVSEEVDDAIVFNDKDSEHAKYVVCIDPLDGSSNIDVNVSVGTIFSIYKRLDLNSPVTEKDFLQKGTKQVCAGYILYGSSSMFVYTTGNGVNGFTLDPSIGEFLLSHPNMKIAEQGTIYSVNEGYTYKWDKVLVDFVEELKTGLPNYEKPHKARYIGSLVSDFHRNLLKGGIYMYPPDKKYVNGKLRLLFEANPMSFLIEQAGGLGSNGVKNILEIEPTEIHQRVPLYIGSKQDVEYLVRKLSSN